MKKSFGIVLIFAFFALFDPVAAKDAVAESASFATAGNDVKVGDYTAFADGTRGGCISFSVYAYANACYSYYAVIDGESYAVRKNPDYNPQYKGTRTGYTHYVRYKNENYYFSI